MRKAQDWHCILISFLDGYDLWIYLFNKYNLFESLCIISQISRASLLDLLYFFIGFCLANIDKIFESHNNVSSDSGFVRGPASKKYVRVKIIRPFNIALTFLFDFFWKRKPPKNGFEGNTLYCLQMVLFSMPIERSTQISSKTICPPLISHVCTNPIVFVYIMGVLLFTICFILGFIRNKAYRNQSKYNIYQRSVRYDHYKADPKCSIKCWTWISYYIWHKRDHSLRLSLK